MNFRPTSTPDILSSWGDSHLLKRDLASYKFASNDIGGTRRFLKQMTLSYSRLVGGGSKPCQSIVFLTPEHATVCSSIRQSICIALAPFMDLLLLQIPDS